MADAAELLTSSGADRPLLGGRHLPLRAPRPGAHARPDASAPLGGGEDSSTLVLNCLPMGIGVPTRLATVATPSVHLEMAAELLARAGPELRPRGHRGRAALPQGAGRDGAAPRRAPASPTASSPASWAASGSPRAGAATCRSSSASRDGADDRARPDGVDGRRRGRPPRAARDARAAPRAAGARLARPPRRRCSTATRATPPRCSPGTRTASSSSARRHDDGTGSLVVTALTRRLLPLVRYDLDDEADLIAPRVARTQLLADAGQRRCGSTAPSIALWGRRGAAVTRHRLEPCAPRS